MPSQTDLDQGGTFRQWQTVYLGPSIGYIRYPVQNQLNITTSGTYTLDPSTNYVTVNATGSTNIILPSVTTPPAGAGAQPGLFAENPIMIIDVGGHANPTTNLITIIPKNIATETIMGLGSISISVSYGGYTLSPNYTQKTWNAISP